jgi:hypothetical protein
MHATAGSTEQKRRRRRRQRPIDATQQFIRAFQVEAVYPVSLATAKKLIATGAWPSTKIGGMRVLRRADLDEWFLKRGFEAHSRQVTDKSACRTVRPTREEGL